MTGYEKFLPDSTPLDQPFWDATRQHRIDLQQCDGCLAFRFIPSEICSRCHSEAFTWQPVSGSGSIYSYTVVHRAPNAAYQREAPYVIAHVALAEGPHMIGNLVDCDPDRVRIGMPVDVAFDDVSPDLTLYRFCPATDRSSAASS
ncbi:MAG: OB-fold domain-containing protein [Ilumatobacteraceae bacterium]